MWLVDKICVLMNVWTGVPNELAKSVEIIKENETHHTADYIYS